MSQSGLIVRRSIRHEIVLPASIRAASEHAPQIRFAKGVADDERWISCSIVDFAHGGAGVISETFFPRGALLQIRIEDRSGSDTTPIIANCRVMRVQMTDRRPAYLIGLAFTDLADEMKAQIQSFLDRLDGHEPEGGSAC